MLYNYFKIAVRFLLKQKLFSFINILSLTVGITCSILLCLYVIDERSFDHFNENKNSIYRVVQINNLPDGSLQYEGIYHSIALGPTLVDENPTVESAVRFFRPWSDGKYYIKQGDNSFLDEVLYADFELFNVFSFPLVKGSVSQSNLSTVVISEDAAKKYFGSDDPINKTLSFRINDEYIDFTVAAVCKNIPSNSSIQFDVLLPFNHIATIGSLKDYQNSWGFGAIITYVKLSENADPLELRENLAGTMHTYYPQYEEIAKERGYKSKEDYRYFTLEPLTHIHFNTNVQEGLEPSSDPMNSYILLLLVVGILIIACFNFMNLSISRSANRIKEVGLRKTIGAMRKQLVLQFLSESILLSLLAFGFSIILVELLLPLFNYLTDKQLVLEQMLTWSSTLGIISLSIFIGIVAGIYPAFVISRFNIRNTLANKTLGTSSLFTKTLVTLQFAISIVLIVGMIAIHNQVNFLKDKDLGFDSNHVIVLNNAKVGETTIFGHLKKVGSNHSGISSMTSANQTFANPSGLGGRGFTYKGESKRVGMIRVTDDYLKTLGIRLTAGRNFDASRASDLEKSVIINEACMKDFDLTVDQTFEELGRTPADDPTVIGIMGDFNYETLKIGVLPMLIQVTDSESLSNIFIKTTGQNTKEVLAFLKKEWQAVAPDLPFNYSFLNETMAAQYASEERWKNIISYSMEITILLSCLGLFGIVALGMESRKKEISVRKVLGAQVRQIFIQFTGNYFKLIMIAFMLAIPASYYLVNTWLETFEYRIDVGITTYLMAAFLTTAFAGLTISFKIVKAALVNPADALRGE